MRLDVHLGFEESESRLTRETEQQRAHDGTYADEHPELFRLLVENVRDYAIFMLDPEGRIVTWNAGAERIKGYRADEIIGQHFSRFYPAEDVAAGKPAQSLHTAETEGRFEAQAWRVRKDGSRFLAHVILTRLNDEQGRLRGFAKVTRDLTERARVEEQAAQIVALRELEERLTLLVEASSQLLEPGEVADALRQILGVSRRLIHADAYAIWVADVVQDQWRLGAYEGLSEGYAAERSLIQGTTGMVVEPMAISDVEEDPRLADRVEGYRQEGILSILVMPLRAGKSLLGTITFYYRRRHEHGPVELRSASALANLASSALHAADLRQHERAARELLEAANFRLHFLAEASTLLSGSLEYERTLQELTQLAVPHLADWCAVHICDEGGVPHALAVGHAEPAKIEVARELQQRYPPDLDAPRGVAHVIRTGQMEVIPEITNEMIEAAARDEEHRELIRGLGLRSSICVPLIARGRTIGALTLISASRRFEAGDISLAQELARRAAVAIDNAELYRATRREQARFSSIVASLEYGVFQIDRDGRLQYVNPKGAELFGFEPEEMWGRPLHDLIHSKRPDGTPLPEDECPLLQALQHGESYAATDLYVKRDATPVDVEIHAAPMVIDGVVGGGVIACQNITERLRQERLKDEFLGFASHELRSPLTSVNGFARWLLRRALETPDTFGEEAVDAIETIESEARRMSGIVEAFLDLTRIQSGRLVIEPSYTDLCALLRDEVASLRSRFAEVEVRLEGPDEPLMAWTDVERLRQVITNLLDNAAKYGGDGGPIEVRLAQEGQVATIAVRDQGPGIRLEDQPHVFDRFFRSHTRQVSDKKGLGVGLYVVKRIVERLGGDIGFVSKPGDGTEFTVRLPLSGPPFDD